MKECPKCKEMNQDAARYCERCGASMTGNTAAAVAMAQAPKTSPADTTLDGRLEALENRLKNLEYQQQSTNGYLNTIQGYLLFFVIITVVSLIISVLGPIFRSMFGWY